MFFEGVFFLKKKGRKDLFEKFSEGQGEVRGVTL